MFKRVNRNFFALFKKSLHHLGIPAQLARHHLSTQAESIKPELPFYRKPWKVFVAVLLERKPVTSKDHTELEQKFDTYQKSLEFEQSSLSSHEVRKIKLAKGSKSTKKKTTEAEEQKRLECEQELSKMEVPSLFYFFF